MDLFYSLVSVLTALITPHESAPLKILLSPLSYGEELERLNRLQSPDNQTELEERSGSPHSPHEMGWISSLLLLTFSTLSRNHQNPRGRSELSLARVPIWCLHQPACLYIPGSDEGSIPRSHHSANLLFGDSAPAGCCVGKSPSRLSFILGAHGFHPVDLELNMFHFATASSSDTGEDVANSSQCASVSLPSIAAWAEYITSTLRPGRSRCERRRATSKSICMFICLLQCRILFPLRRRYFQLCYPHHSSFPRSAFVRKS